MSQARNHYSRAPITEAIIDLHCVLPNAPDLKQLLDVRAPLADSYPTLGELRSVTARIAPGSSVTSADELVGYRFLNNDGNRIVLVRRDGLAFSWLAPYDRWESFRTEARRVWEIYSAVLNPTELTRIGVRYVNRIDIPVGPGQGIELDDYFRTGARIAPELPQQLDAYFIRLQMRLSSLKGNLIITQTAVQPPSPLTVSTLLDIDAVVSGVPVDAATAWEIVDDLRAEKNLAFESCITDRVRDLIR
ncbi:MAG: TIGR04255 family protein [Bryobacteraceae bacterium]